MRFIVVPEDHATSVILVMVRVLNFSQVIVYVLEDVEFRVVNESGQEPNIAFLNTRMQALNV